MEFNLCRFKDHSPNSELKIIFLASHIRGPEVIVLKISTW